MRWGGTGAQSRWGPELWERPLGVRPPEGAGQRQDLAGQARLKVLFGMGAGPLEPTHDGWVQ
jgi:hypothetical protein